MLPYYLRRGVIDISYIMGFNWGEVLVAIRPKKPH